MANLPNLMSGRVAKYGSSFAVECGSDMVQFVNDKEQRWATKTTLASFQLVYTGVQAYDQVIMREFFISKKGSFVDVALSNTFNIVDPTIPGQPYNYCFFENDTFESVESAPNEYTFTLTISQARKN